MVLVERLGVHGGKRMQIQTDDLESAALNGLEDGANAIGLDGIWFDHSKGAFKHKVLHVGGQ